MVAKKVKRHRRGKRRKRFLVLFILLLLLFWGIRCFEKKASTFSESYLPAFARQVTTDAVCSAVEKVIGGGEFSYEDLTTLQYHDGSVSAVETNSEKINLLKSRVVAAAEEEAEKIHNSAMHVPLGAFTGLTLIANYGPKIPLTYCITGSFSAELQSTFEEAGINQTVHHIKLVVTSSIVTASVDYKDTLTFSTDFEIAQSVLVGAIPTTYGGYYTPIR